VQDVEVPLEALADFLDFFHREVGIAPVWLCPVKQRDPDAIWPLYSFDPQTAYINVGFWSSVARTDGGDPADGRINRAIERKTAELGGRKSLYSTSFYGREDFARLYGGETYTALKDRYDPQGRFPSLYDKCVSNL
jgi:FAD/FMN-containing dehydrogenase